MKIWTNLRKGEDRIIAHVGDIIYKCNPKPAETDMIARNFEMGILPEKDMFSIPLYYIDEIRWEEGKKYIQVFFRKSEEHLTIYDDAKRSEIFDYFKVILPSFSATTKRLTAMQAGRKTLIAMVVVGLLFLLTLHFARTIESGVGYELTGRGGLLTAVIGIASLGTKKVVLIFGSLLAIAGISFARKTKRPLVIHRISKDRK
jgi:hypothetical protein